MYRHKKAPNAIGVWYSKEKTRQIADRIHDHILPQYEAEEIINVIVDFDLGENALKTAKRKHYDILMCDEHQLLPQVAAKAARKLAIEYGLGDEARQAAELACYNALMGNEHQRLPTAALEEAIAAAEEFFIIPARKRLASLEKIKDAPSP